MLKAYNLETKVIVPEGSYVTDIRGENARLISPCRENNYGRDGKVYVELASGHRRIYYARVYGLGVFEVAS